MTDSNWQQETTPLKILAVDDRPENLHSLQRILASVQAEIIVAQSGREALAQILRHQFALILLDVVMPEMDGLETAGLIRSHEPSQHIPIIFVTAADKDKAHEDKGYGLGAVDYLFKPLQPHILLSKVQVFLDLANQRQQLTQSLKQIQQLRDNNELLLRAVGDGVLSLDMKGLITFANPAAARFLGVDLVKLEGSCLTDYFWLSENQQANEHWVTDNLYLRSRAEGSSSYDGHWFRHKGGHLFPVEYTISPLNNKNGQFSGIVLVFQDISERKDREALELASKHKSAFLANISHELRTPLHSLLILAKKLSDNGEGNLSREQIKAATVIKRGGEDLLRLINDILDLSKVEAGKLTMLWEPVPIVDIIQHLESQFSPWAAEKKLEFHCVLADDLPDTLHSDRQRLQQILKNLLSNAVKFTHEGTISLSVSSADISDQPSVRFVVSDTGIGINTADQKSIFEAFEQVDMAINRHYEGTGLGLAICRELTRLLGGKITLKSQSGRGSRFTLCLPLQPQSDPVTMKTTERDFQFSSLPYYKMPQPRITVQTAEVSPRLAKLASGKNLLLVDSDMRNSFTLTALLRRHGFRVIKADNYATAQTKLEERRIDVLILAPMAPCEESRDFLSELQTHYSRQPFLIVFLSDLQTQQQSEDLMLPGNHERLFKPLDNDLLLMRLAAGMEEQLNQSYQVQEKNP